MLEALSLIGGLIGIGATIPYVLAALRGDATPNPVTWGVWSLKGVLMVVSLWELGARSSLALPVAFACGRILTLMVALKVSRLDRVRFFPEGVCAAGALVAAGLLLSGQKPWVAMGILLAMDVLGFIPTAVRVWRSDQREDPLSWALFAVAGTFALATATPYRMEDVIFPIWVLVTCLVVLPRAFVGQLPKTQAVSR